MEDISYPYKAKMWVSIGGFLFCALGTWYMADMALENDRGLILNGIIEFSEQGATIFYWVLAFIFSIGAVVFPVSLVNSLGKSGEVLLSQDTLTIHEVGLKRRTTIVKYSDITSINIKQVQSQRFLEIHHSAGSLTIIGGSLPERSSLDSLVKALEEKVGRASRS